MQDGTVVKLEDFNQFSFGFNSKANSLYVLAFSNSTQVFYRISVIFNE